MIFDTTNLFSDQQAITATAVSTNIIDLGAPGQAYGAAAALARDIGKGTGTPLLIQVTQAFNNLTSLTVTVQESTDAAFTSPNNITATTVALADLVAGKVIVPEVWPRSKGYRYIRLSYTVTGTAPSTGKITAGITMGNQANYGS